LDISLFEVDADNQESDEHPKTLAEKMSSYFSKTISAGKFLVRDHVAFKNLKTVQSTQFVQWTPDGSHTEQTDDEKE
jgi:hypothetical protein